MILSLRSVAFSSCLASSFAFGQIVTLNPWIDPVVTGFSHSGSITANTYSNEAVYTRGGSSRTGFYWYWRGVQRQGTSATGTIPLNRSSGHVVATGSYWQPNYTAGAQGSNRVNYSADGSVSFVSTLKVDTNMQAVLGAHQSITVNSSLTETIYFSVASPATLYLGANTTNGWGNALIQLTNNTDPEIGGYYNSPPTTPFIETLEPGNYAMRVTLSTSGSQDATGAISGVLGPSSNDVTYGLKISPSGGG